MVRNRKEMFLFVVKDAIKKTLGGQSDSLSQSAKHRLALEKIREENKQLEKLYVHVQLENAVLKKHLSESSSR